jgi:endonuclease/exonuclease/phosphatase family metal-dependent hydrolase
MKLISLNTWMGIVKEPLLEFLDSKKKEIDIFCFQEVLNGGQKEAAEMFKLAKEAKEHDLYSLIGATLPDHIPFFRPNMGGWTGLAMFINKNISVLEEGDLFVHGSGPERAPGMPSPRNIQYATIQVGEKPITVINFHGLWNGGSHDDAPERIEQSKKISEYVRSLRSEHVLCGDFNLLPSTESLAIIERETGMRNLIQEFGITSTRTRFYKRSDDQYADYTFVSLGIHVKDFKVLPDEISDHSPMYLEFE